MDNETELANLTATLSSTPLAREYRLVDDAIRRVEFRVDEFDATPYRASAVEKAREMWRARMAFEHNSTSVFSQLAAQLMEANATLDAKLTMLRMAQDELRHTATCAKVLSAMGGDPVSPTRLEVRPLAVHAQRSPEERALRNVIYTTCMSEMVAIAFFVRTLDSASEPLAVEATRFLLADERLHGQYGFHYLDAWKPWLSEHPEAYQSINRYLAHAFAVFEQEMVGRLRVGAKLNDDEIALGMLSPDVARETFFMTVQHGIVPGLDAQGFDATKAWRERALAAPYAGGMGILPT